MSITREAPPGAGASEPRLGAGPAATIDPILGVEHPAPVPGAVPLGDGRCRFTAWAPGRERVEVRLGDDRLVELAPGERGYHHATVEGAPAGTRYRLRLDGEHELPDPASRSQPEGPHGPSEVVDPAYRWTVLEWPNPPLAEHVLYELHVGTFTPEGTFAGVIERLDDLAEMGVTAIELMPVSPFSGARGWGYDGVYPWAVHQPYGGLPGLQRLADEAHRRGLAVFLDVVHNHLGPEGNYLGEYAPYFTDRYRTPWGSAINFDGAGADEVRRFFIGSALHLVEAARLDGLRLDAIHAILDRSPQPFLEELTARVHEAGRRSGRRVHVVAENNTNEPRLVLAREQGGFAMDGQWNDDYHHALVALLTGERDGYYRSYGEPEHLARALRDGFTYTGQYSVFHDRRHGRPPADLEPGRLVVFSQNHDQIGNRLRGDRLAERAGFEAAKLAAALVILSPFVPLLFMGEEHAEPAPFLYFTSHQDAELGRLVREGRRAEFASFGWREEPPDPQAESTFTRSKVDWALRGEGRHAAMLRWYRELLALRREHPALGAGAGTGGRGGAGADGGAESRLGALEVELPESGGLLQLRRRSGDAEALVVANLDPSPRAQRLALEAAAWRCVLDSGDPRFGGTGAVAAASGPDLRLPGHGVAVYSR